MKPTRHSDSRAGRKTRWGCFRPHWPDERPPHHRIRWHIWDYTFKQQQGNAPPVDDNDLKLRTIDIDLPQTTISTLPIQLLLVAVDHGFMVVERQEGHLAATTRHDGKWRKPTA